METKIRNQGARTWTWGILVFAIFVALVIIFAVSRKPINATIRSDAGHIGAPSPAVRQDTVNNQPHEYQ